MKKLLLVSAIISCFLCLEAAEIVHPNMFLNQGEINAIKSKLGQEPWKSAYANCISQANKGLTLGPWYIRKPNHVMPGLIRVGDDYYSDRWEIEDFAHYLVNLALARHLSGDKKYSDRGEYLTKVFFLDAATAVKPIYPGDVYGTSKLLRVLYGVDLMWNFYSASTRSGLQAWMDTYYIALFTANVEVQAYYMGTNHNRADWFAATNVAMSVMTGNTERLQECFDHFRTRRQNGDGTISGVGGSVASDLYYNYYALNAISQLVEMARHQGVDLYSYGKSSDGRTKMERYWDAYATSTWTSQISGGGVTTLLPLYENAYRWKAKAAYNAQAKRPGRPVNPVRSYCNMGPVTLTHSGGCYPHAIHMPVETQVAAPVINPAGGAFLESVTFSITVSTSGASVYYTTDGSTPTTGSTRYTGPVTLSSTKTVKAKGFKSGLDASTVSTAVFTVTKDESAPEIAAVTTGADPVEITVAFNEDLDNVTAADKDNYSVSGLSVTGAACSGNTVTLTVSGMTEGTEYTLTVSGIKDKAASPNTMGTVSEKFTYNMSFTDDFDSRRLSWTTMTGSRWSIETDGSDNSYHLNTSSYSSIGVSVPGEMALINGLSAAEFEMSVACKSPESENGNANRDYGVVFGYEDEDNFWYFLANATAANNQLFQVTDGTRGEKLTLTTALIADNEYHTLKITVRDGRITIYQDGTAMGGVDAVVAAGKMGICSYNDEAWFDDVSVTPADGGGSTTGINVIPRTLFSAKADFRPGIYSIAGRRVQNSRQCRGIYFQAGTAGIRRMPVVD